MKPIRRLLILIVMSVAVASPAGDLAFSDPVNVSPPPKWAVGQANHAADFDVLPGSQKPPPGFGTVPFVWWIGDPLTKERLGWILQQMDGMGVSGFQINYAHSDQGGLSYGGKVCHLLVDKADLPANGGPSELGIFRAAYFGRAHRGPLLIGGVDSYVAAIEFENPIAAEALIGYGNSSQSGSPHRTDQLPLFARKELRTVWRTRREVEAHLEARKAFWKPTKT